MQIVDHHSTADVLGYSDAAFMLGVAVGTLYAWVNQRRIPHFRIGPRCVRFSRRALEAWLTERAVPGVERAAVADDRGAP